MLTNYHLVLQLSRRDFSERFSGSILGSTWAYIQPLVMVMIYTLIFSKIMQAKLPGNAGEFSYGVYLVSGILPWLAFSNALTRCATAFQDKKPYISKLPMPLHILPLSVIISETYTFLITLGVFFIFLFFVGAPWSPWMLLLPVIYVSHQLVAYGLGLILATLNVFIKDLKELVSVVLQLWFWFTPIVYVPAILPGILQKLLVFNPATHMVGQYHALFVDGTMPNMWALGSTALIGVLLTGAALYLFRKLERDVRDFL